MAGAGDAKIVMRGSTFRYVASALLAAALIFAFGLRIWWMRSAPPLPALLQGLGDFRESANQKAYEQRLKERFPPGSDPAALLRALADDGFQTRPTQRDATFDRPAGFQDLCRRGGNVRWTLDAAGRIGEVTGGYYVHCP
jgi:hypothetical protein